MSTDTPAEVDPSIPRVLLFGHRGAGKSALLGALLQAGETQGETLRGEVIDATGRLPKVRDAVYRGEKLESTHTELVSYLLRLRPWRAGTQPVTEPMTVILDDCSGKAAETLLEHPEPITQRAPDSPVARAVVEADAIVLLVDAASTNEELAEAFDEFDTFLTVVGRAKTDAREVGGFPIFLVLTQCDRLARPGDTLNLWEARVKDRSEYAWKAFDAYLKDADPEDGVPSPFLPFGSVDLTVLATAVRRPPLSGTAAPGDQPYHVAELFRDTFAGARAHRERVRQSERRLRWTVRFALTAVAGLLVGLATFALFPPEASGPELAERVEDYRRHEPPAAVRLSDARIERNKRTLDLFARDRAFGSLPADLRAFVESRRKEIEDYKEYRGKLANAIAPAATRGMPELAKVRAALETELALPPQYTWEQTAAAELRGKWLADVSAVAAAQQGLVERYRDYDRRGTAMTLKHTFDGSWRADLAALFAEAENPPFPLDEPIPGSPEVNQPRGERVTYRVPYEFDEVYRARRYWDQTREHLTHLRDLADALGMTGVQSPPPALALPEPGPGVDSAGLPGAKWKQLTENYRRQSEGYPEWQVRNFPDPGRSELAARLQRSFSAGVRHFHFLLRGKIGPNPEAKDAPENWLALAATLDEPAFAEWGRLLHLLARLQDPGAPDPVAELARFLQQKQFDLDLRGFELTIPRDLSIDLVEPAGPLTITVTHRKEPPQVEKFAVGKGETRGTNTVYRLTPEGDGKLTYHPGDELKAELPVTAGTRELKLLWESGRSSTFRFDRLAHEPRLTRAGGTEAAPGVRLTPTPGSAIPRFPVLLPVK